MINDPVNHPKHYTSHPSGIECIQVAEHYNFCVGNALKYLWRAGLKDGESNVKDLKKAIWYINREIQHTEENEQKKSQVQKGSSKPRRARSVLRPGHPGKNDLVSGKAKAHKKDRPLVRAFRGRERTTLLAAGA